MPKFSFNPFHTPFALFLDEIRPSRTEIKKAAKNHDRFQTYLRTFSHNLSLPQLKDEPTLLVGSRMRDTDISPLHHIDLFLFLDTATAQVSEDYLTVTVKDKHPMFHSQPNIDHPVSPVTCLTYLKSLFEKEYATHLSSSEQSVSIQFDQDFQIRLTPAWQFDNYTLIPEERTQLQWKKTNPIKNAELYAAVNTRQNQNVTSVVRVMKYWNRVKNNQTFRNYHIEAAAYLFFSEIPTLIDQPFEAFSMFVKTFSKFLYNCPDPTGLSTPVHTYLPDNIDLWYLYMNRVESLKQATAQGEQALIHFLSEEEVVSVR